jgi:hypothetical protein
MASIGSRIGERMEDRCLFKAKRLDNEEWVQGYLFGIWEKRYILYGTTNDIPYFLKAFLNVPDCSNKQCTIILNLPKGNLGFMSGQPIPF